MLYLISVALVGLVVCMCVNNYMKIWGLQIKQEALGLH